MKTPDPRSRLDVAEQAARAGGALARDLFHRRDGLTVELKGSQDRATEADRRVEEVIRRVIRERYPGDRILGEELGLDGDPDPGGLWVVDPIDGTDCFVFGLPMWSVSIAWLEAGRLEAGVVFDPVQEELYTASRGDGARLNGDRIFATTADHLAAGLVGIGHSTRVRPATTLAAMDRLLAGDGLFHRCGSGALSLAWVAAGRLLGYHEPHMNAWDCLAGLLLVREAGGWHEDFPLPAGLRQGAAVTACGPNLVGEMRRLAGG